jgi:hypothetical protein
MEKEPSPGPEFVISTGAQRSGEICGFLFLFSRKLVKPVRFFSQ